MLGESGVSMFASKSIASKYKRGFKNPRWGAIADAHRKYFAAPLARPLVRFTAMRPAVIAEFEDSALLKVFGQAGSGLFAVPSVIEAETQAAYTALGIS